MADKNNNTNFKLPWTPNFNITPKKKISLAELDARAEEKRKEQFERELTARYDDKANAFYENSPITNYVVPFIPEKQVTLRNAGYATGATFSTNLLDSIAVNAKRAGLDLKTAIGLVTKESTLGNQTYNKANRAKISSAEREDLEEARYETGDPNYNEVSQQRGNRPIAEVELVNYNIDNPYVEATNYAYDKTYSSTEDSHDWDKYIKLLSEGEAYADRQAKKRLAEPKKSVLQKAFEKYKQNPKSYNPGQANYVELVNKRANEVWTSPEIVNWRKTLSGDY